MRTGLFKWIAIAIGVPALAATAGAAWLYVDAHRERGEWFERRHGELDRVDVVRLASGEGLVAERVQLGSTSGLETTIRVVRPAGQTGPLTTLMLLGGHRTGADAVDLFDDVSERAVVAFDYPYDGPVRTDGFLETLGVVPGVRRAFLDAAPAFWLATDWLVGQPWVDADRLVIAGVSLGVPFAATAAARDSRIDALLLVHGAADNREWISTNIARQNDLGVFLGPAATIANWLVYGPLHDTAEHVSMMSPRPVVIVGAREDERVPAGETERLFEAADEPKVLRWTEGRHVQPGRKDIVDELMRIADAEFLRLLEGDRQRRRHGGTTGEVQLE